MDKDNQRPDANSIILIILIALLPLVFRFSPIPLAGKYFGHKIQLLEIAFPILVIIWFFISIRGGRFKAKFPPGTIFFLAFVLVAFISSLMSIDPKRALIDTAGFFYLYLLFFFFYNLIVTKKHVIISLRSFLVISFIIGMIGLTGLFLYKVFGTTSFAVEIYEEYLGFDLVRICSTFYTSNYFLIYMGFSLVISLTLLKYDEKKWVKGLASLLILLVIAITLTGLYRGAFVIWGVLFFGISLFEKRRVFVLLKGIIAGLFLLFFSLFIIQGYINISPVEISHDTSGQRFHVSISTQPSVYANLHRTAVKVIKEHPVIGVGPGLYNQYMDRPEYGFDFSKYPWHTLDPHSTYLGYFAETGIFGLLFLTFFFGSIVVSVRRVKPDADIFREFRRLFLVYFILMLVYALFVDIVMVRFIYFAYALCLSSGVIRDGEVEK